MVPPSPPPATILFTRLVLLFLLAAAAWASAVPPEEEFTEELLLRPLPDRKALSHFYFRSFAPPAASVGRHHHLFPKAISQLVRAPGAPPSTQEQISYSPNLGCVFNCLFSIWRAYW